jgi:hypothetical protein
MNENEICAIAIFCFFGLCLLVAGITVLVCHIIDKQQKAKWYKAVATDKTLQELIATHDRLWEIYKRKNEIVGGYKKQIDILLQNLNYLPSFEVEWRTEEAEKYKIALFSAEKDASRWYDAYCLANDNLNEYCDKHKLHRR